MFLDFTSAYNTIQPLLLQDKLAKMRVDPCPVSCPATSLTDRSMSG